MPIKNDLTKKEEQLIKIASKDLIKKMIELKNELLVPDWYKFDTTRLSVLSFIKHNLNSNLPNSFSKPVFDNTCNLVVDHLQNLDKRGRRWVS